MSENVSAGESLAGWCRMNGVNAGDTIELRFNASMGERRVLLRVTAIGEGKILVRRQRPETVYHEVAAERADYPVMLHAAHHPSAEED
jgi:hypothetical protein